MLIDNAPRRKSPFETVKTETGRTYRFKSFTVFAGYCKGLAGVKYASLVVAEPVTTTVIMCDRKGIARLLRLNRKEKSC